MQKFYKKQQKEVEMERIDKTIEILKELLYEDRESLSPHGLDEMLDKAITNLRVFKEVDMKELMFSYFDERNNIINELKSKGEENGKNKK
jgi:glutamyl/glutaminyl-tRNA synthetase|tara:strand:- start:304 stop:573 length:270 start_codon:yes stop_codon:yes gene_type:complete